VTINGTGVNAPTLTPPTLTFATPQALNTTSTSLAATLNNPNTVPVAISSIMTSGDFSVASNTCGGSLGANSSCFINVTFSPTATGTRNGILTVATAFGTEMINLTGMGATPPTAILSPSTTAANPLVFGVQAVGVTSAAMQVTLMNTGGLQLNISAISPNGDFGETDNCLPSVGPGGMCTIMVTFTPSGVGTRNGSILIVDNAAGGSQTIFATGTGSSNVPGFNLSAPLFFGTVLVGSTSATQTVTITNSGGAPLSITKVTTTAQFGLPSDNCIGMIPVGQSCMIGVNFTPNATNTQMGTLTIMDNAPGNPHTVSLSGVGATVNLAPPAGGGTSATVVPGDTATYAIAASSTPGLVATVGLTCSTPAPYTICTVSPSLITVGGATPPVVTVTVRTNCNSALVLPPVRVSPPVLPAPFAGLWVGVLALLVLLRRVAPRPWLTRAAPVFLLLLLVITWAGCVNNPAPAIPGAPTTPVGAYNVTVTGVNPSNGQAVTNPPLVLTLRVI
jgi:hypothetical protein